MPLPVRVSAVGVGQATGADVDVAPAPLEHAGREVEGGATAADGQCAIIELHDPVSRTGGTPLMVPVKVAEPPLSRLSTAPSATLNRGDVPPAKVPLVRLERQRAVWPR